MLSPGFGNLHHSAVCLAKAPPGFGCDGPVGPGGGADPHQEEICQGMENIVWETHGLRGFCFILRVGLWRLAETQPLPITAVSIFQIAKLFGNNPQVVIP